MGNNKKAKLKIISGDIKIENFEYPEIGYVVSTAFSKLINTAINKEFTELIKHIFKEVCIWFPTKINYDENLSLEIYLGEDCGGDCVFKTISIKEIIETELFDSGSDRLKYILKELKLCAKIIEDSLAD